MGLDITRTWSSSYGTFMLWRRAIATAAGLGELKTYVGFGGSFTFDDSHPLTPLLSHSDCDGVIEWQKLDAIVTVLREISGFMLEYHQTDYLMQLHEKFIEGCEYHIINKIDMEFH